MKRIARVLAWAWIAPFILPSSAYAAVTAGDTSVRLGLSAVGLIVAVLLLLEAVRVRRVAFGGAIAERMSYVVLAVLCLAGSALAQWARNFVVDVTQQQVQLASEALVITAMALLALYFYSVRSSLQKYLKAMTGSEMLASTPKSDEDDEV